MKTMDIVNKLREEKDEIKINEIIKKIKKEEQIASVLSTLQLDDRLAVKIINQAINEKNVWKIVRELRGRDSVIEMIENYKKEEINEAVRKLSKQAIYKEIRGVCNKKTISFLIEQRKEDVKKVLKFVILEPEFLLRNASTYEFAHIIWEVKEKQITRNLKRLSKEYMFSFLSSKYIKTSLKYEIVKRRRKQFEKALNKESTSDLLFFYLKNVSYIPAKIREEIVNLRKEDIIKYVQDTNDDFSEIMDDISYGDQCIEVKKLLIDTFINKDNLYEALEKVKGDYATKELIKLYNDEIVKLVYMLELDTIPELSNIKVAHSIQYLLYSYCKDLIEKRINELSYEEKYRILIGNRTLYTVVKIILKSLGFKDVNTICFLIKGNNGQKVLDNYESVKNKIIESKIDYKVFCEYGIGTKKYYNWFDKIMEIDDIDKFNKIRTYLLENYYINDKENKVYEIKEYLELVTSYQRLYPLLKELEQNNIDLTKTDKLTLKLLLENDALDDIPSSYEKLKKYKEKEYELDKNILKEIIDPAQEYSKIDRILEKTINPKQNKVSIETLKLLLKDNCKSKIVLEKTKELMIYTSFLEKIEVSSYKTKLDVLKIIYESYDKMNYVQNIYMNYGEKIRNLYELEMNVNLTNVSKLLEDGKSRIDLSNKNYILCAHVVSTKEKDENLVNGIATGKTNFISMSPISYKGQKYYYDLHYLSVVLLYDYIPKGAFICSSLSNMGTNSLVENNSLEFKTKIDSQRGILETSSVTLNNAEILLYREGIRPCGIRLEKGKTPNIREEEMHKKYHLPYIITQPKNQSIENPKMVFEPNDIDCELEDTKIISDLIDIMNTNKETKENEIYTGRELAIFTDVHSMFEPLLAILEDIRKRNITEIYSLGDNVGLGPNPCEVMDLLDEYNVKSVAGNSEYYNTLGIKPFPYFNAEKKANQEWTSERLGSKGIDKLKVYPASIDLLVGDKKIALCHFINDVRWDFVNHSTWSYQENFIKGVNVKQFEYTNSLYSQEYINKMLKEKEYDREFLNGFISSCREPLFNGKMAREYTDIFQGHVHFRMNDKLNNTNIYTLRAAGMGWKGEGREKAEYYILKERKDGSFDVKTINVDYNKNSLICNIKSSSIPYKDKILSFLK